MNKPLLTGLAALVLSCGPSEPTISTAPRTPEPTTAQESSVTDSYAGFQQKGFVTDSQAYGTQDPTLPISAFHGNIIPELDYTLDIAAQQANRDRTPLNTPPYDGLTTYFKALDIITFLQEYQTDAPLQKAFTDEFGTAFNDLWIGPTLALNGTGFDVDHIGCGILPEQGTTNYHLFLALKGTDGMLNATGGNPLLAYYVSPPLTAQTTALLALAFTYWNVFVKK